VLLFIFIGFVFIDVTADVVYRIADKVENDFPYVVDDETIYRYQKGIGDDIANKEIQCFYKFIHRLSPFAEKCRWRQWGPPPSG
jgi:hypothetical protein